MARRVKRPFTMIAIDETGRVGVVRRRCVLVVDDEDGTRRGLERWLSRDYEVITAKDGAEGLQVASAHKPRPDVIISDVWMPGLDGVSMVKCLKQHALLHDVPVIFLTGQTSPQSMIAGIAVGARAYLCKPIDLDALDKKVRSALASRKDGVMPPPRK